MSAKRIRAPEPDELTPAGGSSPRPRALPPAGQLRTAAVLALVVLVWRGGLLLIFGPLAARGPYSRGHLILGGIPHILSAWAQWDSGNYLSIAQQGYGHIPGDVAFFPLFPLVLRILGGGTVAGGVVAAMILNTVALIGAIILLYQAASRQFGPRAGRWAVAAMLLVPTAFFFGAVYTEATFLLLALAARAAAIRRHFLVASLLAALATASRFPGVLVWILVVAEWWEARRAGEVRPLTWLWLPLGLAGLVGYAVWLQVNFGDALAFNRVETTVFGHVSLLTPGRHPILVLRDILGFAAVAAAVLFLRRWIPWRRTDVLFLLCSVGVVILSGGFRSSGRYLLVMYPLYFGAGLLATRLPRPLVAALTAASTLGLLFLTFRFTHGYWVG